MLKVTFKDEGQDFLEWYIENGVVVACRPFQEWLWKGIQVHNRKIRPGDHLEITGKDGVRRTMLHPVESITEQKTCPTCSVVPEVPKR